MAIGREIEKKTVLFTTRLEFIFKNIALVDIWSRRIGVTVHIYHTGVGFTHAES